MPGLTQGLEIARKALLAHQASLSITGNNIANVNTPGFSRQRPVLTPTPSERTPDGILGTGVRLDRIERVRDIFIDNQIRDEMGLAGNWAARANLLSRMEDVLNEPSDVGLASLLDGFWNAWLDLSNQPEDAAARSVVIQSGDALAAGLRHLDFRVRDVMDGTDIDLQQRIEEINGQLQEVASLNAQIARAEVGGEVEPTLRDRRDEVLDELARQGGAVTFVRRDKTIVVRMGGRTVVEGNNFLPLETQLFNDSGHVRMRIAFRGESSGPAFLSGELAGLLGVRDQVLPDFLDQIDFLAENLVSNVNRLHEAGPSHLPFFRGTTAESVEVNPEVANDPSQVNAGTTGDPGDNDIALALGALRNDRILNRGSATLSDFYRTTLSELGSIGQQANFLSESQDAAVTSLESRRQATIGVNLDEELTRMISTQKAYEAAARVFSAVEDMLDILLKM